MKKGYYEQFLEKKSNPTKLISSKTKKKSHSNKENNQSGLSDIQMSAYQWAHEKGVITLIDNVTKQTLLISLVAKRFLALFKIGAIFRVFVTPPKNDNFSEVKHAIKRLLNRLKEKRILPMSFNPELIAQGNQNELLYFFTTTYQFYLQGNPENGLPARLQKLSEFLISLGINPPASIGNSWFTNSRPLYLVEDPLRNGELLRSLCVVIRPEVYESKPPPAKTPSEITERIKQALVILSEDGYIDNEDTFMAEGILRGTTDTTEKILFKFMNSYNQKSQSIIASLNVF